MPLACFDSRLLFWRRSDVVCFLLWNVLTYIIMFDIQDCQFYFFGVTIYSVFRILKKKGLVTPKSPISLPKYVTKKKLHQKKNAFYVRLHPSPPPNSLRWTNSLGVECFLHHQLLGTFDKGPVMGEDLRVKLRESFLACKHGFRKFSLYINGEFLCWVPIILHQTPIHQLPGTSFFIGDWPGWKKKIRPPKPVGWSVWYFPKFRIISI